MAADLQVLAPRGTRVLSVVLWVIAVGGFGWLLLTTPTAATPVVPFVALFCLAVYVLAWRPCVFLGPDRVVLRNVLRDITVPFSLLDDVTTRFGLTLHAGGRRYQAWGAPSPGALAGRPTAIRAASARATAYPMPDGSAPIGRASGSLGTASGAFALMVRNARQTWLAQPDAARDPGVDLVSSQWHWWIPILLVVLTAWCVFVSLG